MDDKPSIEFYGFLQSAFEYINQELFDKTLTPVIFTITRKKNTAGYFRPKGWASESGELIHEIAINPDIFVTTSPLELMQVITHECVHLWQHEFGKTEPRRNYHNKEWVDKMLDIGLTPISDNGKGTGQKVSDEPTPGGRFEKVCLDFFTKGFRLGVIDSECGNAELLKHYNLLIDERVAKSQSDTNDDKKQITDEQQAEHDNGQGDDPKNNAVTFGSRLSESEIASFSEIEGVNVVYTSSEELKKPMRDVFNIQTPEKESRPISKKTAYQCPNCKYKLWGAPNLPVGCLDCHTSLVVVNS